MPFWQGHRLHSTWAGAILLSGGRSHGSSIMIDGAEPVTKRALVVGGDPEVLRLVSLQLRTIGYEVVKAESATEALHILSIDDDFDLLVTDFMLPHEITGMELERRVHRAFGSRIKVRVAHECLEEDILRQHGTS